MLFNLYFMDYSEDAMRGLSYHTISYHEKEEQKFETTSYHYSGASNTKFLQKNVYKRKKDTINIIIIITNIIIVIIIVVIIINFFIIIIVNWLPLLFEDFWDEENTL